MTPFFSDPAKAALLITEAKSWWQTPFAYFSRAKGAHGGIDCVGFIEEVTAAAGLERFAFPRSDNDYSRHVHNDKILNHLRGLSDNEASRSLAARWAEFPISDDRTYTEPPIVGDLLILKDGGDTGVFHLPIMISPTIFMHCAPGLGVIEGQIDDPTYSSHLAAHFRARESAISNQQSAIL